MPLQFIYKFRATCIRGGSSNSFNGKGGGGINFGRKLLYRGASSFEKGKKG